ncbi:MAG: hypothetical protein WBP59_12840 [Ilumatobacteraceae bacterium]
MRRSWLVGAVALLVGITACGGDDGGADDDFVGDIRAAMEAVEAERGPGQQYFEVTATPQLTNVFVATDEGTAAIPYVYLDGELQAPAPKLTGASGFTFEADMVDFDEDTVLSGVLEEVPGSTIESVSVEGGVNDTVRYVVSVRSTAGGLLDVTVGPDGDVFEVDPV